MKRGNYYLKIAGALFLDQQFDFIMSFGKQDKIKVSEKSFLLMSYTILRNKLPTRITYVTNVRH